MFRLLSNRHNLYHCGMDTADTLTISPDMVRLNDSKDADWMAAVWALVRRQASAGRSVRLTSYELTYTPAEVARLVGVSKMTVLRRIDDGTIKARKRGAYWRIPASQVDVLSDIIVAPMVEIIADELDL